jgi:hypothetical protein
MKAKNKILQQNPPQLKNESNSEEIEIERSFSSTEMRFFNETIDYTNYDRKGIRK